MLLFFQKQKILRKGSSKIHSNVNMINDDKGKMKENANLKVNKIKAKIRNAG